jgi:hypothetical protein
MSEPYPENDWTGAENNEQWDLCVYATDASPKGQRAIANLRRACEEHLKGRYQIEIVDVLMISSPPTPEWAADTPRLILRVLLRRSGGRPERIERVSDAVRQGEPVGQAAIGPFEGRASRCALGHRAHRLTTGWTGKVAVDQGDELVNIERLGDSFGGSFGYQQS